MKKTTIFILVNAFMIVLTAGAIVYRCNQQEATDQVTEAKTDSLTDAMHAAAGRIPDTLKGSNKYQNLLEHALAIFDKAMYYRDLQGKNEALYKTNGGLEFKVLAIAYADSAKYFQTELEQFNQSIK